jgi:DNA polymerase-1
VTPKKSSAKTRDDGDVAAPPVAIPVTTPAVATPSSAGKVTLPHAAGRDFIFLIDTMSFIFRAYHAMTRSRPMTTRSGIPTAATYVFVNMLRKLREDFAPPYLAAVFDVLGPTFRDEQAQAVTTIRKFDIKTQTFQEVQYHGYKANRAAMPEDLAQQLPYIRKALEGFRIPILEADRFEADDVIGTLSRQASERGIAVYIVSSDKDMLQLVDQNVWILNPPKDNLICDAAKVQEILGVPPERVVDVMALRGDSVDNIPGAPGIGDKGSVELIQRFGTVEEALDRADEVEKKTYRESLQNNRDMVIFSKQMATIDTHVPMELDTGAMRISEPNAGILRELFRELEFTTMLKELTPEPTILKTNYSEAKSAADVERVHKQSASTGYLAIAIEGVKAVATEDEEDGLAVDLGPAQGSLLGLEHTAEPEVVAERHVGISAEAGAALTVALGDNAGKKVKELLADVGVPKAIHDSKAAIHACELLGIQLEGVEHDVMLYSYLLDPTYTSHALADVAQRRLDQTLSGNVAEAADVTGRLAALLRPEVEEAGVKKMYEEIEFPLVPVLARMERAGVKIDTGVLAEMSSRLTQEIAVKARQVYELAGTEFNINSPKQLGDVLFNRLNLPKPMKHGKGRVISTAADVMEELALVHDVPRMVLEYRQLSKLKSTYVDALPSMIDKASGRLHTTFSQTVTATGRLSSVNPNLQNIPIRTELGREVRAAFIAEPGYVLLAADYSQIELRLLAHFSQDPMLVEAYRRGDDIHTLTAAEVFGVPPLMITDEHRRSAKAVNFGIVYGLSAFGLSQQLGIDKSEAKRFIDRYFDRYQGVRAFIDATLAEARREQKVRTLSGRVRPIPDINSKNANQRGFAERTAVNTPLQGTAADLIKIAMIRIDAEMRERGMKSRMTLQVHDELVFEVAEAELDAMKELVREKMENAYPLTVPLLVEVGVGKNWRDLE